MSLSLVMSYVILGASIFCDHRAGATFTELVAMKAARAVMQLALLALLSAALPAQAPTQAPRIWDDAALAELGYPCCDTERSSNPLFVGRVLQRAGGEPANLPCLSSR